MKFCYKCNSNIKKIYWLGYGLHEIVTKRVNEDFKETMNSNTLTYLDQTYLLL
jgi:hypothetical protein